MNYRHAYHAGNHTEVFKHAVLVALVRALHAKDKPIFVLDTHAGPGLYDLDSAVARKTCEAEEGIRVAQKHQPPETLAPYLEIVGRFEGKYPGSPSIVAALLRPRDRGAACELHEDDHLALRRLFINDPRMAVHHRDGYKAMGAFVPPPERRGLVFCDPPFEETDELATLASALIAAYRKWPTGVYAAWYPIKETGQARPLHDALREAFVPDVLGVEFLRTPIDGEGLAGSGMVIVNPPWKFDAWLEALIADLARLFGKDARGIVCWVTEPAA